VRGAGRGAWRAARKEGRSLPDGGWYLPVQVFTRLLGQHVRTSVDARADLATATATDTTTVTLAVRRLRDLALTMRHNRAQAVEYALRRARQAVPTLDQTVANRRHGPPASVGVAHPGSAGANR